MVGTDTLGSKALLARRGRALMLLLALSVLPYANALRNELVYDDHALVAENPQVRWLDPRLILEPSLDGRVVEWYRPLTIYSFAVNYALGDLDPLGYHVVNVALHAANVWLLYTVALRVLPHRSAALLAAGLFAVHALHVEAVTPASGRADLLATLFVLLAWRLALPTGRRFGWGRACAIGAAALAGLLAKESAIALPPLIALTDVTGVGWSARAESGAGARLASRARVYAGLVAALSAYLWLRVSVTGQIVAAGNVAIRAIENPLAATGLASRLITAVWVLVKYCALLVAPVGLSADYSSDQIPVIVSWRDPRVLAAGLLAAGMAWAILASWRRDRIVAVCLLMFVLLWLPISNTVIVIGTIMGERLMYLPSVAFALLAGAVAARLQRDGTRMGVPLMTVSAVVAAIHVGVALDRNRDWRSQEALFRDTVERSPKSAKAHFNYGIELLSHGRREDAAEHFRAALRIAPAYAEAQNGFGTVLLQRQDLPGAEALFRAALTSDPRLASAWTNLGTVLFRSGRDEDARRALEAAVRLRPTLAVAHATLGAIAERKGEEAEAIAHYEAAFRLAPAFEQLGPHLAALLTKAGRVDDARRVMRDFRRARSSP